MKALGGIGRLGAQRAAEPEVEITSEMIEAGLTAVMLFAVDGYWSRAPEEVYRAMESVRRRSSASS